MERARTWGRKFRVGIVLLLSLSLRWRRKRRKVGVGCCHLQEVGHRLEVVQSPNWDHRSRSRCQACPQTRIQTRQLRLLLVRLLGLVWINPARGS